MWAYPPPHPLMVSLLDSRASGPGSRPDRGHCVVFLGKTHFSHGASLHSGTYKWVPVNLMLRVTLRWTSIPSRGESKYSQSLHATETRISYGLMGHLALTQTLPLLQTPSPWCSRHVLYLRTGNDVRFPPC